MKKTAKILPGFFVFITLFVFAPAELYLTNTSEFWFSYRQILPGLLVVGVATMGVITVVLFLLPEKTSSFLGALIIVTTILLYLQGNFFSVNYGTLDGEMIDWSAFSNKYLLNGILWVALITCFIFLYVRLKESMIPILRIAACIIMGTQILSLTVITLTSNNDSKTERYLSKQNEFSVSSGHNTIVILLDCFDAQLFSKLYTEHAETVEETFQDFTYCHNMVGGATRTKYAIPYLFSGFTNTKEQRYSEYLHEAYQESPLFAELRSGDYSTGIFSEKMYIDLSQNTAIDNIFAGTSGASSHLGLTKDYLRLVAFRYSPSVMNRYFWMYSGDFDKWKGSAEQADDGEYAINDILFFQELTQRGLSIGTDKSSFRFYHLNGAHVPYAMNEVCQEVDYENGTEESQAIGCFYIIKTYLQQLKQLGLYDDATVIVMSDHGYREYSTYEQTPLFLLKEPRHKGFEVNELSLSYRSFPDILVKSLRNEIIDLSVYVEKPPRLFYTGSEVGREISITEYYIYGHASDSEQISIAGVVSHGGTQNMSREYSFGDRISFTEDGVPEDDSARAFFVSGFSRNEGTHTWTDGQKAELLFELPDTSKDLVLEMVYGVYHPPQRIRIFANEQEVYSYTAYEEEKKEILIPASVITSGNLNLVFEFPDAISPSSLGNSDDKRLLALAFRSMTIREAENNSNLYFYSPGQEITFTSKDNGRRFFTSGISKSEKDFAWSMGNTGGIALFLGDYDSALTAEFNFKSVYHPPQELIVRADGQTLFAEVVYSADQSVRFDIPAGAIHNGLLKLELEYPNAASPKASGESEDVRDLAFAFQSMDFSKAD